MIRVPSVFVPVPVVTAVMSLFPPLPVPVLSRVFALVSVPAPASTPAATPALASASAPTPNLVPLSLVVLALVPVPPIMFSVILFEGISQGSGLPVPQLRALTTLVQGWEIQHGGIREYWGCI